MALNLLSAHKQWAERPADERFWTLDEMQETMQRFRDNAVTGKCRIKDLKIEDREDDLYLVGSTGQAAEMTHFAFGQLCRLADAPSDYIRRLHPSLAAANMNYGLELSDNQSKGIELLLGKVNGHYLTRCLSSERYCRIWNVDILRSLRNHLPPGWRTAPARPTKPNDPSARPATESDLLNLTGPNGRSVRLGDMIAPAGLYGCNENMFVFMINEKSITGPGGNALGRGFFLENTEVVGRAFKLTTFLYSHVCGNHIVWGASNVNEIRIVHIGDTADERAWKSCGVELRKYADEGASDIESKMRVASIKVIGHSRDEVIEELFKIRNLGASKGELESSWTFADEFPQDRGEKVSPNSYFGMSQGMSRFSQTMKHADARTRLDRVAGKILEMAF